MIQLVVIFLVLYNLHKRFFKNDVEKLIKYIVRIKIININIIINYN